MGREIVGREEQEKLVKVFEEQGLVISRMPVGIYPGMPYVTIGALLESGLTRYSSQYIEGLVRRGVIRGFEIAGKPILVPMGVRQLILREQASLQSTGRGRKPGRHVK